MLILAAESSHPWYDNPLVVAVCTVILTLLTTQVSGFFEERHRTRRQAKALRGGFLAEVGALQHVLAHAADLCLEHHKRYTAFPRELPTKFYEANVGRLSELHDPGLAGLIVKFYSGLGSLVQLIGEWKAEEHDEDEEQEFHDAEMVGQVTGDNYLDGLLHLDFEASMLLCFLTDCGEYTDQVIGEINATFARLSTVQGKSVGKMYREGKKVLMSLDLDVLKSSEQWCPSPAGMEIVPQVKRPVLDDLADAVAQLRTKPPMHPPDGYRRGHLMPSDTPAAMTTTARTPTTT